MISVRRCVTHHFLNIAVENTTEVVDGGGIDGFIVAQAINGGAGNVVLVNQRVRGFFGLLQGSPEWLICNHTGSPLMVRITTTFYAIIETKNPVFSMAE